MKNFITTLLSIAFLSYFVVDAFNTSEQTYVPVVERITKPTKGAKGALEYLHRLKANNEGVIPIEAVINAREAVNSRRAARQSSANTTLLWQEMGPDNAGGRTRAILIDKDNSNLIYAGGVSGGLWKSTNGGNSWNIIDGTDKLEFSGVVSICQTTNGDIYFGTGEGATSNMGGNSNGSSAFIGGGIYKSTDGGNSFTQLASTAPSNFISTGFAFAAVTELASHRTDPNTAYAATRGGLKLTKDGGTTWTTEVTGEFFDVEVNSDNSVIASKFNTVFFSEDGTPGSFSSLPSVPLTFGGGSNGRIELAIAPSDANYIYAIYSNQGGLGKYKGIYRSTDKGQSWELVLPGWSGNTPPVYNIFNEQANYAMTLAVDPLNKNRVIIGGLDLWEYEYGVGIEPISYWAISDYASFYVHADQHEIVFDPNNPQRFFIGNDGGVYRTDDNGENFSSVNRGYGVTQFYTVDYSKDGKVIGGTQDNGTQFVDFTNPASNLASFEVSGGDGGYTQVSFINPDILFCESQNGSARRSADGGETVGTLENFLGDTLAGLFETAQSEGAALFATFINPMNLWEEVDEDGNPVDTSMFFAASTEIYTSASDYCVYMTKQALDFSVTPTWFQVTPIYSSPIERISVTGDGNHMFFSRGGNLYRTDNLNLNSDTISDTYQFLDVGSTASDNNGDNESAVVSTVSISSSGFQYTITDIAINPNNKNHIVVTVGGYANITHVFESTNATSDNPTFTSIQGNLPDMPVYSAVIDVHNSDNIIIGTEFGVWSTTNGNNWTLEDDGMPIVPCHMLRQQYLSGENKGFIYVGTHGRGIFKSSNTSSIFDFSDNGDDAPIELLSIYPNPAESFVNVELSSDTKEFDISIIDLMGKEVYSSSKTNNTRIDISSLEAGNYVVIVIADGNKQLGKFIKTK
jgi:photosystem II stability/assembly factor-like uncharacterized protein